MVHESSTAGKWRWAETVTSRGGRRRFAWPRSPSGNALHSIEDFYEFEITKNHDTHPARTPAVTQILVIQNSCLIHLLLTHYYAVLSYDHTSNQTIKLLLQIG